MSTKGLGPPNPPWGGEEGGPGFGGCRDHPPPFIRVFKFIFPDRAGIPLSHVFARNPWNSKVIIVQEKSGGLAFPTWNLNQNPQICHRVFGGVGVSPPSGRDSGVRGLLPSTLGSFPLILGSFPSPPRMIQMSSNCSSSFWGNSSSFWGHSPSLWGSLLSIPEGPGCPELVPHHFGVVPHHFGHPHFVPGRIWVSRARSL